MPSRINAKKKTKTKSLYHKGTIIIIILTSLQKSLGKKKYSEIFKVLRGRNSNILFYGL